MCENDKKIRICHFASGDVWAGAEVQVFMLLSYLATLPLLKIKVILLNNRRLAQELQNNGIDVTIIDETEKNSFVIFKELLNYFKKNKIDILHTHSYKENVLGGIAAKMNGVPCIVMTVHSLSEPVKRFVSGLKRHKKSIISYMNDKIIGSYFIDKFIAVSNDIRNILTKKLGEEKIICIHNGIDLEKVKVTKNANTMRAELGYTEKDIIIGFAGRLAPIKGVEYFIKAARNIVDNRKDTRFLIIGDGHLKNSLELLSAELNLQKYVKFIGHKNDIYNLLKMLDIFVLPSLHEGLPMVLLEATFLGKPVIASNVGGIPEVINGKGGELLIRSGDANALAEKCLKVINNLTIYNKDATERKKYIADNFSNKTMGEKTMNLYRTLLLSKHNNVIHNSNVGELK